jgi:uncharacterized protein YndB with AHSA1/START domain
MAKEVTIERIVKAPVDKVWDAWTQSSQFAKWFGAPGKVDPASAASDLKVGGAWKVTTVGDDGSKFPFSGKYRELNKPGKLVLTFDDPSNPANPNVEVVIVMLQDLGDGKTQMIMTQAGNLPDAEYEGPLKKGWNGFFDKLDQIIK